MATKATIGLLPLYLKLYDEIRPELRNGFTPFMAEIAAKFTARGFTVVTAPICRVAGEFDQAITAFEQQAVDCIVTLHLAYSPSLEVIDALCATELPILLLDTTMDADFGRDVATERIMYNHGVHGVMDLAALLRRRRRPFEIVAGHYAQDAVMDRAAGIVGAAVAATAFGRSRLLRVGHAFAGMGDFQVDPEVLAERFGIQMHEVGLDALDTAIASISTEAVAAEVAADRASYACELDEQTHTRSVLVGLGLRKLLADGHYDAFSVNFQPFDSAARAANTMPFLEISKAMARGIGYAGEGDLLTAALVGALANCFAQVSFTEIFCADWSGNSLFLAHMGEISPTLATGQPRVTRKPYLFGDAYDPAVLTCAVQPGPAVFVNLAPGPDNSFALLVAPVEVLPEDDSLDPAMRSTVRAWLRPQGIAVAPFLEAYSRAGGTHHSALVLGDHSAAIAAFGRFLNFDVQFIGG